MLQEFLDYTNSMEFTKPTNEYHMIDELIDSGEIYTSEELQTYKLQVLHWKCMYKIFKKNSLIPEFGISSQKQLSFEDRLSAKKIKLQQNMTLEVFFS